MNLWEKNVQHLQYVFKYLKERILCIVLIILFFIGISYAIIHNATIITPQEDKYESQQLIIAGISLDNVKVSFNKKEFYGNIIFTHRGLSGTSIMKASEFIYLDNVKNIFIDILPDISSHELLDSINSYNREKEVITFLNKYFPKRLCNYIVLVSDLSCYLKIKNLTKSQILKLIDSIKKCSFEVLKTCDIEEAYVTGGGIDMKYINSKTMESTINKGVYFVGECLDIHGPIGGYNITLALSTGYTAGISVGGNNEKA